MKRNISFLLLLLSVFIAVTAGAQATKHTINGKVISFEESLALEGVTIKLKGTQNTTGTQADGTFTVDITDEKQVIVFELADYEPQEIVVGNKHQLDIVLKRKNSTAQHLSVTGYSASKEITTITD